MALPEDKKLITLERLVQEIIEVGNRISKRANELDEEFYPSESIAAALCDLAVDGEIVTALANTACRIDQEIFE